METESVQPHPVAGGLDLLLGDHPLIQGKDAYYPALYNLILSVAIAFEYKKNDKILSIQNHLFRFHFFAAQETCNCCHNDSESSTGDSGTSRDHST